MDSFDFTFAWVVDIVIYISQWNSYFWTVRGLDGVAFKNVNFISSSLKSDCKMALEHDS